MTDFISRESLLVFIDNNFRSYWDYPSVEEVLNIITNAPAIKKDKQVSSFAWALIMETAASFEVASYSISDADAKKSAEGVIKYARDTANKYYTTSQQPQSVADALEEMERALCLIGVVGNVDGHDVIRRDSVINVARQRIKRTPKEGE